MDYWRLCDELSVLQAAALIVGIDPSSEDGANCDRWSIEQQPLGYHAAKSALIHAINGGRLAATIRHGARDYGYAEYMADVEASEAEYVEVRGSTLEGDERLAPGRAFVYKVDPDWSLTTIALDDLRAWLRTRGITTGFFFANSAEAGPHFLSREHPRFAPKLAAAVRAWEAIQDPGGKHPKQALMKWLREHASEFQLSDDDGKPNEQGIEECAKVANWQPSGGPGKASSS
jgi:hypothetical protein